MKSKSMSGDISAALDIHQWLILPGAALIFIAIIYTTNTKISDLKRIFESILNCR